MKLYLEFLAATIIGAFAAMIFLAAQGIDACFGCDLVKYQEFKMATASPNVETVFLGDSSLGYALDAKAFSKLDGKLTLNLALTGWNYGFPAAYSLLVELLKKVRPKNVVISLTPQDFIESIAALDDLPLRGFIQASRQNPHILFSISPLISWRVSALIFKYAFDKRYLLDGIRYASGQTEPIAPYFEKFDYLPPINEAINVNLPPDVWTLPVTHDYDAFFQKMAELCHQENLNCLYLHSTLFKKTAEKNRAFIEELGNRIERAGIRVPYKMPIEIPDSEIGNTINHVLPQYRQLYTQKFFELLSPLLR